MRDKRTPKDVCGEATVMAAGPTGASSLQFLVLLLETAVLIQESISGDVLGSYQATSVSKTFIAPEFVSYLTNHRRFNLVLNDLLHGGSHTRSK